MTSLKHAPRGNANMHTGFQSTVCRGKPERSGHTPENAGRVHGGDVILVLVTVSWVDVGKDVVSPEAGDTVCRWGIAGGSISARRAIVAVEMVCQDVGVLEGLPSLLDIKHSELPQKLALAH